MLRYMLDTNFCIRLLRDRPAELRERMNEHASSLYISTIVLTELLHGAENSSAPARKRAVIDQLVSRLTVLPFDEAAATHAANIRAVLQRQGQLIGGYDLLIAGHARSIGLVVVTANTREFCRVDGVMVENW